jgi:hypothetical protein
MNQFQSGRCETLIPRRALSIVVLLAASQALNSRGVASGTPPPAWSVKPYRVLLVVERWSDPASVLVDHEKDDFQPVAALLKAWSVPFDIFRLDQQHLDSLYLFDRSGQIRYGTVIWAADPASYSNQNLADLADAVRAGTSLLVAKSRFLDPVFEKLLGAKFKAVYTATDPLQVTHPHFLTRELAGRKMESMDTSWDFSDRFWVEPQGADVLIAQTVHPAVTVNHPAANASAVWLGVSVLAQLRDSPYWRNLFFRSLLWDLGYLVVPNQDYAHRIEIEIDDWGTPDKGFLSYWRYQTPSEDTLRQHLIAPLKKHRAVVAANVITGYVDRKSKRVIVPWTQKFTDAFGVAQDYGSTYRGLKAAVQAGVLEIECHGLTHMQADLDSPPGPWWTEDLAGEASAGRWYTEFEDQRRGTESPAIVQLFHMRQALQNLSEDFGQSALELRPGGAGWSKSYVNQTGRLAAIAGFGLFHAEPSFYYYLDRGLVLDMTGIGPQTEAKFDRPLQAEQWPAHPDGPVLMVFHDRDISFQPDFIDRLFSALPSGLETLSANQYIGIMHTQITSSGAQGWQLKFIFDDHYCAYFANHPSSWRVWLADPFKKELEAVPGFNLAVDGKSLSKANAQDLLRDSFVVDIPTGLGAHTWSLTPAP